MAKENGRVKPILNLETDKPLPTVRIDGQDYPLNLNVEYAKMVALRQKAARIAELGGGEREEELTEQEEAELSDLLDYSVKRMLDAPAEVISKLTDFQLIAVTTSYYHEALGIMDPTGVGLLRSSPDSTGSMER